MRIIITLIVLWVGVSLRAQDPAIVTPAPEWRQPSVGRPWSMLLAAAPEASYAWSVAEGALPPGIHLVDLSMVQLGAPAGPALFGAAAEPGTYRALLRATGPEDLVAEKWMELTVSLLSMRRAHATAYIGGRFEFRPAVESGVAPFEVRLSETAYVPLGLTFSADGVLQGDALIPGRYEVPVLVKDAGANELRTTLGVTVYGPESALPPVAVRIKTEGCKVTAEWPEMPEQIQMELFGGENGEPLEIVVTHRESGERVRAVYAGSACPVEPSESNP